MGIHITLSTKPDLSTQRIDKDTYENVSYFWKRYHGRIQSTIKYNKAITQGDWRYSFNVYIRRR